jgi:phage baseplate assembly protein W
MSDFWSDFDDSFGKQSDGDIQKDSDITAIFNSLTNILRTVQGERRMVPTFASNLSQLLFEPIDDVTARRIAESLLEAIKIWEDRIEVTGFDIEPRYDENLYRCRLNFVIVGSDEIETVDFILTR